MSDWIRASWPIIAPTPLSDTWGWGSRVVEIITTPLGLIFWAGVWIGRAIQWPFRRLFS
jgi:hypothetical protein